MLDLTLEQLKQVPLDRLFLLRDETKPYCEANQGDIRQCQFLRRIEGAIIWKSQDMANAEKVFPVGDYRATCPCCRANVELTFLDDIGSHAATRDGMSVDGMHISDTLVMANKIEELVMQVMEARAENARLRQVTAVVSP